MFRWIDRKLNQITMYRLVLYYVASLWFIALILCTAGVLAFNPLNLIFTLVCILGICWAVNNIFVSVHKSQTNVESVYITVFILALIITPIKELNAVASLWFIFWVSVWAIASKFIIAIRTKHIFNPAGFAVALTALTISQSASWWVGTAVMLPFVAIGGFLVIKKIQRFDLIITFLIAAFSTIAISAFLRGVNPLLSMEKALLSSAVVFFACAMLSEPLTTPPTRSLRIAYGALVGFLFAPSIHIGSLYSTPELALLVGNLFSYIVSPKWKLLLTLKEKIQMAPDVWDFVFSSGQKLRFHPGQYMEWTLSHDKPDNRGNRRYFTVASAPTEDDIRLGIKWYPEASSFKEKLLHLEPGDKIGAAQLAGDFTLSEDPKKKLVFIAGGIGVTPFRSMLKYLLDKNEARDIVMFYSGKSADQFVYHEIFDQAEKQLGIKTIYALTDPAAPATWQGERGFVNAAMIAKYAPDFKERMFYISGPRSMVVAFQDVLKKLGVPRANIKSDFFPGLV